MDLRRSVGAGERVYYQEKAKLVIGAAVPGFFKDQDVELLERQVKTNYFSVMWTAHVYSPPFPSPSPFTD